MGAGVTPGLGRCSAPGMFRAAGAAGRDARLADVHCCWARVRLGPRRGPSAPRDTERDGWADRRDPIEAVRSPDWQPTSPAWQVGGR